MAKFKCIPCGYIYDEDKGDPKNGIDAGTKWSDFPDDWVCPLCGVGKDQFEKVKEEEGTDDSAEGGDMEG